MQSYISTEYLVANALMHDPFATSGYKVKYVFCIVGGIVIIKGLKDGYIRCL